VQFEEALNTPDPKEGLQRLIDPALGEDYPIDSVLKVRNRHRLIIIMLLQNYFLPSLLCSQNSQPNSNTFYAWQMTVLARACTQQDPKARPKMRSIVVALLSLSSTSEFWDMNAIPENQGLVNLMSGR
jgi:chitin elicitor receptor kinase 1